MPEDIESRIVNYLKAHDGATEDEIAEALGMHVVDVLDALATLKKEGSVKSTEVNGP